ncbi:T9SS type A sorting domain-containing protein, partial [bacterium]|nr:T9SS type A sorting domain-containing protein [bacterium]
PDDDCDDCEGKVTELTLQYNGTIADANIQVVQKKDDVEVFNDVVQPGEQFTFYGEDKHGTLGTEISIFVNGDLNTKIHTSCSQPIGPGLISGDFEVIAGRSKDGGPLCPVDVPPDDDCDDCEGKVTELTLQYNGTIADANIQVVQKKDDIVVFDNTVQPGEEFTFVGADKHGTLGTEISIFVDNILNTKIHTSCSQPIGPGLISGDFEVISGRSKDGGLLCPVEVPSGSPNLQVQKPQALVIDVPRETRILQNFPNPFNPETWIPFELSEDADVKIDIYDMTGRLIRKLDLGYRPAGYHVDRSAAAYWNGRNSSGERVASGSYFYRLVAGERSAIRRMLILK